MIGASPNDDHLADRAAAGKTGRAAPDDEPVTYRGLATDLRAIVDAVEIESPTRFRVLGTTHRIEPEGNVEALAKELYLRLYARFVPSTRRADRSARERHLAALSAANTGRGAWRPGWRVARSLDDGWLVVEHHGLRYWVAEEEVRPASTAGAAAGDPCRVFVPKELGEILTDFYIALGDADERELAPDDLTVRLYWHLTAAAAVPWMTAVTTALNRADVPFRLKTLSAPTTYYRADAAVIYLDAAAWEVAGDPLRAVYRELRDGLRPEVPRLTRRLAPGLGLAEGRGDRRSFGQDRCHRIAEALVQSYLDGVAPEAWPAAVADFFRTAGLDPARPHLAPGSRRRYPPWVDDHVPIAGTSLAKMTDGLTVAADAPGSPAHAAAAPGGTTDDAASADDATSAADLRRWLAAARAIAGELDRRAYRHRDRCGWVGHGREKRDPQTGRRGPAIAALGPHVWSGTAGVALFLAELHADGGDGHSNGTGSSGDGARRDAAGAARQALAAIAAEPERYRPPGFYCGRLGVGWAARRVATLIADDALAADADDALARLCRELARPEGDDSRLLDVISGNAGAIPTLLGLHRETGDDRFLATAVILGDEILAASGRDGARWWWDNEQAAAMAADAPPLTGISHGAAGIGLALYELHTATGAGRFRRGADGAFVYEDALFDPERCDWPDFRGISRANNSGRAGDDEPAFPAFWCHGAPGIVLARLRVRTLDAASAGRFDDAIRAGLDTTLRTLDERLEERDADASLCHGLCGLIDVALYAAEVLGEERYARAAEEAMDRLLTRHQAGGWPSGARSRGYNPSLFLGEAGVGYTLLRLYRRRVGASVPGTPLLPGFVAG